MHELLLFGQVPTSRHDQLLKIIAGIAAMQPQRVLERHLIFKPSRKSGPAGRKVGGSQGIQSSQMQALQGQMHGEMFYMQLVGEVREDDFTTLDAAPPQAINGVGTKADVQMTSGIEEGERGTTEPYSASKTLSLAEGYHMDKQKWALQFNDLPEVAGRRPVTSRMISSIDMVEGSAMQFMDNYVSEYILEGHQVIHNNVMLLLHRILRFPPSQEQLTGPYNRLHDLQGYPPVDTSGAYVLQASVRLQDGNRPESISLGLNELKSMKKMMKGVVELEPGDRLALDTRVKS
ncbi:MAG: hypothetical protein M1812_005598 [Candelaria pacifica]|nr:MAG: hypothetical protein M1812_005598 [Candelaria pacifica]